MHWRNGRASPRNRYASGLDRVHDECWGCSSVTTSVAQPRPPTFGSVAYWIGSMRARFVVNRCDPHSISSHDCESVGTTRSLIFPVDRPRILGLPGSLRRDPRATRVAVPRVLLERDAAARAVAGGAREPGAALGAELGIGLGPGTVLGTSGKRDTGNGGRRCTHVSRFPFLASRVFRLQRGEGFGGVPGLERVVVRVREFSRRAVEFDLLERAQGDGLGREVVVGILPFVCGPPYLLPRPSSRGVGSENRLQHEEDPACGEQDPGHELEQAAQEGSRSSSRRRRASSSGVASASPRGAATAPGWAARTQRRSTSVRATPATTIATDGTKYPARLNPRFGGAMRMAMPFSRTN